MSLLDVINAQKALATRLKMWGVEVDVAKRAESFIDDLVSQGWIMSAQRETRPAIPSASEACRRCGGRLPDCACTREHLADDGEEPMPPKRGPGIPAPDGFKAARRRVAETEEAEA